MSSSFKLDDGWYFQSSVSVLSSMVAYTVTSSWLVVLIIAFFTFPRGASYKRFSFTAAFVHLAVLAAPYLFAWATGSHQDFHDTVLHYVVVTTSGMRAWLKAPLFQFAVLSLAPERLTYGFAWLFPERFKSLRPSDPVDLLYRCFLVFKVIQVASLGYFFYAVGGVPSLTLNALSVTGALLFVSGQVLNAAMSHEIGKAGVFYGVRLATFDAWSSEYPFNLWVEHPQYFGAWISVLGLAVLFANEAAVEAGLFGVVLAQGLWYMVLGFVEEFL